MSYGSLSKKSPETAPSPGKFSSRVYKTNINICWMKFSVTFKLFAFQEDSKKNFCPWQVLGFLGLHLKKSKPDHTSGKQHHGEICASKNVLEFRKHVQSFFDVVHLIRTALGAGIGILSLQRG